MKSVLFMMAVLAGAKAFALEERDGSITVNPYNRTLFYVDGRAVIPATEVIADTLVELFKSPDVLRLNCRVKYQSIGAGTLSAAVFSVRDCQPVGGKTHAK